MIREIAGRHNHALKLARKLQQKKHRRERGLLVGEGLDLLAAAVEAGADILEVLVRRELFDDLPPAVRVRAAAEPGRPAIAPGNAEAVATTSLSIGLCSAETLQYASALGGAADVIFVARKPVAHLASIDWRRGPVFYLDEVGDPGNVGTLCRSAVAFGLTGVLCSPGTADPYSPKALRAGMGAQFLLPVATEVTPDDLRAFLGRLREEEQLPAAILVADPHAELTVAEMERVTPPAGVLVIVLGDERQGPLHAWAEAERIAIPQVRFDSLNVAMAGTVLAYEARKAFRPPVAGGK